jgi:hypothetical protein
LDATVDLCAQIFSASPQQLLDAYFCSLYLYRHRPLGWEAANSPWVFSTFSLLDVLLFTFSLPPVLFLPVLWKRLADTERGSSTPGSSNVHHSF